VLQDDAELKQAIARLQAEINPQGRKPGVTFRT